MAIDTISISRKIKIFLSAAIIIFVWGGLVYAADVTIGSTVNVPLTIGSETITFEILAGSLNAFTVDTDKVTFSVPQGEKFYIQGPSSISFGAATVCDTAGKSKFEVEGTVTVTPTKPATTAAEYKNTCDSRIGGGGSGGGGSSAGGGGGATVTPSTTQTTQIVQKTTEAEEEKIEFVDIGKLKADVQQNILQLAALMVAKNTYDMPANKKFQPNSASKGEFVLQAALAVSGDGCGESGNGYPGASKCKKQATTKGVVTNKFKLNVKTSRAQYYEILLKAIGVKLASASVKDLKAVCKDAKSATSQAAKVFMTAKNAGIASVYKGSKCGLVSAFPRWQAAQFAVRALNAK